MMILSKEEIRPWLRMICHSDPDYEIEATIISSNEIYLRYAMNRIHQPLDEDETYLSIRVLRDGHIGEASANQVDEESVENLLEKAKYYCHLSTQADTQIGFTGENELCRSCEGQKGIEDTSHVNHMIGQVERVFDFSNKHILDAAGVLSFTHRRTGFATTHGGQVIADHTCSRMNVMFLDSVESKSGWASQVAASPEKIDTNRLTNEALNKVTIPKKEIRVKPGEYPAILDFYACAEIFSILSSNCFSGSGFHDAGKISAEHLGEELFHPSLNLWDDGCDLSGCPTCCDFEGITKQRIELIDHGKLAGAVYDRETAAKQRKQSTGHAQSRRELFASGPQANNLFIKPGDQTIDEMIQSVERGIWITRFQYTTLSDPTELVISGSTRDGTFWIENGKIQYALPNLPFRVSIYKILKEIQGMSQEVRLLETDFGVIQTPCIKARDFTIL